MLDKSFALENQGDADARDNKIWSLGATWAVGPHSFTVAHQRSTGDTGYLYGGYRNAGGIGDGGNTILLANSYWSDFNGKDERSWQAGYGLDFSAFGVFELVEDLTLGATAAVGTVVNVGAAAVGAAELLRNNEGHGRVIWQ